MKAIKAKQYNEIAIAHAKLMEHRAAFNTFIGGLTDVIEQYVATYKNSDGLTLDEIAEKCNEASEYLTTLVQDEIDSIEDYVSERSDKWHDSESADQVATWVDSLNEYVDGLEPLSDSFFTVEVCSEIDTDVELPPKGVND